MRGRELREPPREPELREPELREPELRGREPELREPELREPELREPELRGREPELREGEREPELREGEREGEELRDGALEGHARAADRVVDGVGQDRPALGQGDLADLGAQVVLLDSDGQPVSELQELMGGHGRGQVMWPVLHFVGVDPTTAYTVRVFPMADRRGTEPSASPQGRPYVDIEGVVPADLITGAGAQRLDLTLPLCDRVEPLPTGDTGSPSSTGDTGVLPGTGFTADTGTRQGTSDTGRRPSLTGDTGSGPATSTAVDTSGPSAQGPVAAAGCGCASGSVPTAWGALLGLLIGLRRRRVGPRSR